MTDTNSEPLPRDELLRMTARVVSAYVGNNPIADTQISDVIQSVYGSLHGLGNGASEPVNKQKPAVPIKRSITPDRIICLEDGKQLKMLKRHLSTAYNLSLIHI